MLTFTLFNVGHGFCAHATTPGGADILFDCGYDDELQFYPSRYFSDRNITRIYGLVLSHFDQDHVANLPVLRSVLNFDVIHRNPSIPADFVRREKRQSGVVTTAMASALEMHENWTGPITVEPNYGGVKVTYFYNPYGAFTDMNNLSLVTFVEYSGCGIVVPGDMEREGWLELLKLSNFRQCLSETNIFIASHHGRTAGYCEEVFEYCHPDVILLSDKNIVHGSQEQDYAPHANGIEWNVTQTRYVLTTRCDGHIRITKRAGEPAYISSGIVL